MGPHFGEMRGLADEILQIDKAVGTLLLVKRFLINIEEKRARLISMNQFAILLESSDQLSLFAGFRFDI